jgi:hypothetical protein
MKTLPGPTKLITLVAIFSVSICTIIAFAAEKAVPKPPKEHSIMLRMGQDGDKEPLHCSRASLEAVLKNCAPNSYKIDYHSKDGTDVEHFPKPKETGGASSSPHKDRPGGGHSTQQIAFGDVEELKAFVDGLKPES